MDPRVKPAAGGAGRASADSAVAPLQTRALRPVCKCG